jgi:hypothetical protein
MFVTFKYVCSFYTETELILKVPFILIYQYESKKMFYTGS